MANDLTEGVESEGMIPRTRIPIARPGLAGPSAITQQEEPGLQIPTQSLGTPGAARAAPVNELVRTRPTPKGRRTGARLETPEMAFPEAPTPGVRTADPDMERYLAEQAANVPGRNAPLRRAPPESLPEQAPVNPEAHPNWIHQRLPTAVGGIPEGSGPLKVETDQMSPAQRTRAAEIIRSYPNIPDNVQHLGDDELIQYFHDHVVDNLLGLHDATPQEIRERSKLWYGGGRAIVDDMTQQYGIPDHSAAGVLAALSPQQDWYKNVSLAHRVVDTVVNHSNDVFDEDMVKQFRSRRTMTQYRPLMRAMRGRSYNDIDNIEGLSPEGKQQAKALFVRMHDETHRDSAYPTIYPEGESGDNVTTNSGREKAVAWKSLSDISRAIQAVEARDNPERMVTLLGRQNKIRNFYNNLLDPHSPHEDITIDTHAVAAGLMRPLAGEDTEVMQNFGNSISKADKAAGGMNTVNDSKTGIKGLYPIYADAYREAARRRGLLPREMQSVTWEAIRGLFTDVMKRSPAEAAKVAKVWEGFTRGQKTLAQVRSEIYEALGGIKPPTWYGGPIERYP